jgi:arylsulfatase A-like enzyme
MDIFATACDAAGVVPPPGIDGVSFLPTLRGEPQPAARQDNYFVRREGGLRYGGKTIEAFRRGDWKILQDSPFAPLELYNLNTDPREATNLAPTHPQILETLDASLRRQIQSAGAVPWQKPPSE